MSKTIESKSKTIKKKFAKPRRGRRRFERLEKEELENTLEKIKKKIDESSESMKLRQTREG